MIIINRMFSGSYLKDNIGHEWINLFKSDSGNYLYLNPDGTFNPKRVKQYVKDKDNYMLMVKNFDKEVWQVIAVAKLSGIVKLGKGERLIGDSVTYNGVALKDIFSDNEPLNKQNVTFKADEVRFPESPVFITQDSSKEDNPSGVYLIEKKNFNFAKQSLRQYVNVGDSAYELLINIVNEVLNGPSSLSPSKVNDSSSLSMVKPTTLFEIIHKENDELMYSDMLKFYLEDEGFAKYFIEKVLDVTLESDERVERVEREEFNIDLLIRTNKRLIVIENKIHSGINGKDKPSVMDQYKDVVNVLDWNGGLSFSKPYVSSSTIPSQLTKYYIYAEFLKQNEPSLYSKPNSYFILCPEYKKKEVDGVKEYMSFNPGNRVYKVVTYKDVYDRMLEYKDWINFSPDKVKYWNEFIYVMARHTKSSPFEYELEQMRLKFIQATQMKRK